MAEDFSAKSAVMFSYPSGESHITITALSCIIIRLPGSGVFIFE
jgi:hypothetical protein